MDHELKEYADFSEVPQEAKQGKYRMTSTMFPPSAEEAATLNLDRCLRCVPHEGVSPLFLM